MIYCLETPYLWTVDNKDRVFVQVLERIGHGSFGEVLKATHKPTGKLVALKKVPFVEQLQIKR